MSGNKTMHGETRKSPQRQAHAYMWNQTMETLLTLKYKGLGKSERLQSVFS